MNRKIRFLIISIILIAGVVFGINFVSNAAMTDAAFGEEIEQIENKMSALATSTKYFNTPTVDNWSAVLGNINKDLDSANTNKYKGTSIESIYMSKYYKLDNIICLNKNMDMKGYNGTQGGNGPTVKFVHQSGTYDLNLRIKFDETIKTPSLVNDPTYYKMVHELNCEDGCETSPHETYSNYNMIEIYNGPLKDLKTTFNGEAISIPGLSNYYNDYKVPFLLSLMEDPKNTSLYTSPSDAQKVLWAFKGGVDRSELNTDQMRLYRTALAVNYYIMTQKSKGKPSVTTIGGSEVGSAYLSTGAENIGEVKDNLTEEELDQLQGQEIVADGVVRIGPFKMSNYAYAFSEDVQYVTNKDVTKYPDVLVGIVDGEVVIDGTAYKIDNKAENSQDAFASIVYKDWYDQVPMIYEQVTDIRGSVDTSRQVTLDKTGDILYLPKIDGDAKTYSTGFNTPGATELFGTGSAASTANQLKVLIRDDSGNYTVDYPFPLPNSVFYIEVPVSCCGSAESVLSSINFTYRTIETDGNGQVIIPRATKATISFGTTASDVGTTGTIVNSSNSHCTTYSHFNDSSGNNDGTGCYCGGGHKATSSSVCHDCWCDTAHNYSCTHPSHTSGCWGPCPHNANDNCDGKCNLDCSHKCSEASGCYYDCDCSGHTYANGGNCSAKGECRCYGHGAGYSDSHGTTYCKHGHNTCSDCYWKISNIETKYGQPLLLPTSGKTTRREETCSSSVGVLVLERIYTTMTPTFIWHGFTDCELDANGNPATTGLKGFINMLNWDYGALKAVEVGDRVTYKATIRHTASVPLYIWVRVVYPLAIVADRVADPVLYMFNTSAGEIIEKMEVVQDKRRTTSALIKVNAGATYSFSIKYTQTNKIRTYRENGKIKTYQPMLQVTSKDYKWKVADSPDLGSVNIDFVRTHYGAGASRHYGPVLSSISQESTILAIKQYVVNINKYIYDVQHTQYTNNATVQANTIAADNTRGYTYVSGGTNLFSKDELIEINKSAESAKQASPVYVEYGDKITYKIEVGNGKINNRYAGGEYDYDVDEIYVTLVDELPKKYSNLKVTLENRSIQGAHLTEIIPNPSSSNGGTIKFVDLMIPRDDVVTITVSFVIEEHERNKVEKNRCYVEASPVYNANREAGAEIVESKPDWTIDEKLSVCEVSGYTTRIGESCEWYKLNDYDVSIDKYLSSYKSKVTSDNNTAGFTNELPTINSKAIDKASNFNGAKQGDNEDTTRMGLEDGSNANTSLAKENSPYPVEKTDQLIYSIKVQNNRTTKGSLGYKKSDKFATIVRPSEVVEELHPGLKFIKVDAVIYNGGGTKVRQLSLNTDFTCTLENGKYIFRTMNNLNTILYSKQYIVYYVHVEVEESNMSLEKLYNHATIVRLANINAPANANHTSTPVYGREIQNATYNENISKVQKSSEYVKMKDLVISGKVWLDLDRDGQMNDADIASNILSDKDRERYLINSNGPGKADVTVRLYSKDNPNTPLRTTYTDANGMYTFSRSNNNSNYYANSFDATGESYSSSTTYQRIDKATKKDEYGNYIVGTSQYIEYYVEFEYDGILYKSTEVYSEGVYPPVADDGMTNLTGNGNYNDLYETDSNAFEKKTERERFNRLYEYISFNSAFDMSKSNPKELEFEKENHISLLNEDKTRVVRARSFINNKNDDDNYLWLYQNAGVGGAETEYLKYINLGLELREEVDISLTKDVYKVKTTVNGETMEYDFNQNNALNGASTGLGGSQRATNPYLQDFIIKKPYGLELYEFDYKFRVDQYFAEEVRNYKGSASELNVEVTYRITIDNKPISDADDVLAAGKTVTKTPLFVRVNEIMDLYEVNFIELGEKLNDEITVKIKQEDGTLRDEIIKTVEAWYFVEDTNGTYIVENDKAVQNGAKPIYKEVNPADVPAATTKYARKDLTIDANSISADSKFTDNQIDYKDYGYNKLFIRGMDDIAIGEDKSLDVYVKYILDKGEEQFELNQESINAYEETSKEATVEYNSAVLGDAYGSYTHTIERQGRTNLFTIQRTLKIKDPTLLDGMTMERTNNRGLEGIAQINAYSVWYSEDLTKPASLVDRNSNVGNIGAEGESPDDYTQYDDTVYKTGIVISVEQTATDKNNGSELSQFGALEVIGTPKLQRVINGTVWDDARSVEINEEYSSAPGAPKQIINKQYVGNGIYSADPSDLDNRKQSGAIANENVAEIYKRANGDAVTENNDFPIRNVKAEFIEIVKKEDASSPTGYRYYEQHLQQVTWPYQQWDRTDDSGYYELKGFVPGTYIIRFTYGDNVNTDGTFDHTSADQRDMLIFNGHDYKSTQFNKDLETIHGKDADKIMEILEAQGVSDALDDEIRRLEVNSYSEVMTNPKAEILKGTANGVLTTREEESTRDELKALIENTTMQAETVEFLVKAEKLTTDQINKRKMTNTVLNPKYELYSQLKSVQELERNERKFTIAQIDFGLEYRPEAEIRLVKEIEEVKVITEDKNVLVDLFFYTENKGTDTVHKIDKNKSKGLELVQFVSNEYHVLLKDLTNEDKQGFVFVQVDEEILQGSTIDITYKFEAENNSEIDRIAVDLERIRYKENEEAKTLLGTYDTANELAKANYTASGIAAKVIKEDFYNEDTQGVEYRTRQKTLVNKNDASMPFDAKLAKEKLDSYYGRFVGYAYYTGDVTKLDTVASLKFDKILDFVDVNIEYIQQSEQASTADKFWIRTKSTDLKDHIYQLRTGKVNVLENGRGYSYDENLVVSVDDRIKDDKYSTRYSTYKVDEEVDSNIRNNDLSRFLLPQSTVLSEAERDKSVGTVRLNVSKVLSAEADKKDMSYENLAEVIQFTTLTGRRTDFGTTIGNSDVMATALSGGNEGKGSLEFVTASFESDTAATETITLIPPTGLMRNRRAIVNVVEATTVGVGIVFVLGTIAVILIMIITMVLFVIRKYKKRRIV